MSTAGQKRKNQDTTELSPKRRRCMSPPPPTSGETPKPKIIYIIKRKLSQKELTNELAISPTMSQKFALTGHNVVNFGRDPSKNKLVFDSNRPLTFTQKGVTKQVRNNDLVSRQHGKFIFRNNSWYIFDKSTNGIIVNSTRIPPLTAHPLDIGDEIIFGINVTDTEFKYIFTRKSTPRTSHTHTLRTRSPDTVRPPQTCPTPRFDTSNSSQSQPSQSTNSMSFDAEKMQKMLENATQTMLSQQRKQFDEALKKKDAETDALREEIRQKQLKEIQAKEDENRLKQQELQKKAAQLQQSQIETEKKRKENEMQIALEKQKNAEQISKQTAELQRERKAENEKTKEREKENKKKLQQLIEQQKEIEARDKKQRELNQIEQQKWQEKQAKLLEDKKKMEEKEKQIKEKEAKVKENLQQKQSAMEEECECCICCDVIVGSRSLQCGHTACHQCLDGWMAESKTCPSCRSPITRDPVPCIIVDNLIVDTYLKEKSIADREEYMGRKREYGKWKKKKEEDKKRAEEEKKRAAAAAIRYSPNRNNRNNRNNNYNDRRHGVGSNVNVMGMAFINNTSLNHNVSVSSVHRHHQLQHQQHRHMGNNVNRNINNNINVIRRHRPPSTLPLIPNNNNMIIRHHPNGIPIFQPQQPPIFQPQQNVANNNNNNVYNRNNPFFRRI